MNADGVLGFDLSRTALVLIDLQHGIVTMQVHPEPSSAVVARAAELAAAFRAARAPVVLVTVGHLGADLLAPASDAPAPTAASRPANWSTVVDQIGVQPGDLCILKRQWGAFYGTELDLQLRRRGIRTLVLAGIATHLGVESTARDAYERGYEQVFVADAIASPLAEAHDSTMRFVFPRIGRLRSTAQVLQAVHAGSALP